jgi:membrane protein DedA with SNARE-associated domain
MWEEILKAVPVFLSTMIKFVFGPLGGYASKLNILTTIISTISGMMTAVIAFTFFGTFLRERVFKPLFQNRKKFTPRNRKITTLYRKYGLGGIAFFTPILLTPIGGTLIAVSFGSPKEKIILYMFISGVAWAIIFSIMVYFFGNKIFPDFIQ